MYVSVLEQKQSRNHKLNLEIIDDKGSDRVVIWYQAGNQKVGCLNPGTYRQPLPLDCHNTIPNLSVPLMKSIGPEDNFCRVKPRYWVVQGVLQNNFKKLDLSLRSAAKDNC